MTKIRTGTLIGLALVALALAVPALLYPQMPEQVPTHWNAYGEVDDTTGKPFGPFIGALASAFVYALYLALPRLSPRGYELERFQGPYDAMMLTLVGVMTLVSCAVALAAAGYAMPIGPLVGSAVGVAFAVLGNYMGKVRTNYFVGIRTPWTLANEEVWLRTHRLAGKLFVLAGVAMAITSFFGPLLLVGVALALVAGFAPMIYSYVLYRRLAR